jgi:hypothetical protein
MRNFYLAGVSNSSRIIQVSRISSHFPHIEEAIKTSILHYIIFPAYPACFLSKAPLFVSGFRALFAD